ncbi:MAG: right-handed parallel beta-helix repeat-containing protein, partial [Kiritimatiellae bacterium]|nr:right-handed parallel beta-helix repeat-containing protein [Kiritimatiellia bacterium]
ETGADADIGNVILDGGAAGCLFKRGARAALKQDLDFWCDPASRAVVARSDAGNPALRWRAIEAAEKIHGIDICQAHDFVVEDLAVRFSGAHGFGGGGTARAQIRRCDISWIGGGYLYVDKLGNGVRYGNGIELWGDARDITVENCRVSQCWDAGLTNQSNVPGSAQRDIVWRGNEVTRCEYSYEFWQQGESGQAQDIVLEHNVFRDAGFGWGHAQRWNPNAAHLMLYDTTTPTPGFTVRGNRFSRSADVLARIFNVWRDEAVFSGNRWESAGEPLCRHHGRPRSGLRHLYPDRLDQIHHDDAAEIEAQGAGARLFAATPEDFAAFEATFGFGPDALEPIGTTN